MINLWNWMKSLWRKPTPMLEIKKLPLAEGQYIKQITPKKYIFIHHTAGGSVASAVNHWANTPERIATAYVIERTGDVYECFGPEFWAYSLGVKGNSAIERATIAIEIVSFGNLTVAESDKPGKHKKGDFLAWTGRVIPPAEVVQFDFRGSKYYHRYTDAQILSVKNLIQYLMKTFGISLQEDRTNFWDYRDSKTLPMGVWSHSTVRKDKVDIFPQKELVDMIYGLPQALSLS